MFAPRLELVISEMVRVCKPGGKIAMRNWTPNGLVGQMFKVIGKHVPPPLHVRSPLWWGNEVTCRERLGQVSGVKLVKYERIAFVLISGYFIVQKQCSPRSISRSFY